MDFFPCPWMDRKDKGKVLLDAFKNTEDFDEFLPGIDIAWPVQSDDAIGMLTELECGEYGGFF